MTNKDTVPYIDKIDGMTNSQLNKFHERIVNYEINNGWAKTLKKYRISASALKNLKAEFKISNGDDGIPDDEEIINNIIKSKSKDKKKKKKGKANDATDTAALPPIDAAAQPSDLKRILKTLNNTLAVLNKAIEKLSS